MRRHPAFLQQFPDLALTLVVPRENGPAASLASYLLFEPAFVQALAALGEQDAYARKDELLAFFPESPVQATLATA